MRIFFAQLCNLYTFFLAAIVIIVALGAPLENVITTPMLKRDKTPTCPTDHPVYRASLCSTLSRLLVFCEDRAGNTASLLENCDGGDVCIEHNSPFDNLPHATCVTYRRKWDNFNNPYEGSCSQEAAYIKSYNSEDLVIAITTYSTNGNPIQVSSLDAYVDGNVLSTNYNMHNYSQTIQNYNEQKIRFCFNGGTDQKVIGYAVGWAYKKNAPETFSSAPDNFNIASV